MAGKFVVVTTSHRGVFAGVLEEHIRGVVPDGDRVVLSDARMCVYWDQSARGVVGLASHGPSKGCKITRTTPRAEVLFVDMVLDATPAARVAWEAEPWAR